MTPDDPLVQPKEAAEYLGGLKVSTLQWWRVVGRGPQYVKIGHRVVYRKSDLDAFIAKGTVNPETEAA
jgi:predicted DNA-binding transcriptional regulator AlpA